MSLNWLPSSSKSFVMITSVRTRWGVSSSWASCMLCMSSTLPIIFGPTWLVVDYWLLLMSAVWSAASALVSSLFSSSCISMNCWKDPLSSILRLFRSWGTGFELCFNRWIVLPFDSAHSIKKNYYSDIRKWTHKKWRALRWELPTSCLRLRWFLLLGPHLTQSYADHWRDE